MANTKKETVAPKEKVKAEVKTEVKAEKKPRKPREKVRSIEEIYDLPIKKLTDKEKDALLKHMRENTILLKNQVFSYKQSAESAFERARDTEQRYEAMEKYYLDSFKDINTQLSAFSKAVTRVTGGAQ